MSLSAAVCPRKRAHSRELDRERKHEQEMSLSASVMVRGASRFFSFAVRRPVFHVRASRLAER